MARRATPHASGARTAPGARPPQAGLSAHELRVAVLATNGCSNRDIGDAFGVSSRSVEHHLTSVYQKLRITGRRQLGAALAAAAARPRPVPSAGRPADDSPITEPVPS